MYVAIETPFMQLRERWFPVNARRSAGDAPAPARVVNG
jgi:hypothetical protein